MLPSAGTVIDSVLPVTVTVSPDVVPAALTTVHAPLTYWAR